MPVAWFTVRGWRDRPGRRQERGAITSAASANDSDDAIMRLDRLFGCGCLTDRDAVGGHGRCAGQSEQPDA